MTGSRQPVHVVFVGPPGGGKSTVCAELAAELRAQGLAVDTGATWRRAKDARKPRWGGLASRARLVLLGGWPALRVLASGVLCVYRVAPRDWRAVKLMTLFAAARGWIQCNSRGTADVVLLGSFIEIFFVYATYFCPSFSDGALDETILSSMYRDVNVFVIFIDSSQRVSQERVAKRSGTQSRFTDLEIANAFSVMARLRPILSRQFGARFMGLSAEAPIKEKVDFVKSLILNELFASRTAAAPRPPVIGRAGHVSDPGVSICELDEIFLPRLLYVGDIPIESTFGGSAALYRLLQNYPSERLHVAEMKGVSSPDRRLRSVRYHHLPVPGLRLLSPRLHRFVGPLFFLAALLRARGLWRIIDEFRPEALLSVAHEHSWLTAASVARRNRLPLHLIVHDGAAARGVGTTLLDQWVDQRFASCYSRAASRLCVCDAMEAEYRRRYGVAGTVLYPSRAMNAPQFDSPPARLGRALTTLRIVYGGSITNRWTVEALSRLAAVLAPSGGRVVIYGPSSHHVKNSRLLEMDNVEHRGIISFAHLIRQWRTEADAMFLPFSFRAEDGLDLSFPSKLVDYSGVGVPLLIYAPPSSPVTSWARKNRDAAIVVEQESEDALGDAVQRLIESPGLRQRLGSGALEAGKRSFSQRHLERQFFNVLRIITSCDRTAEEV